MYGGWFCFCFCRTWNDRSVPVRRPCVDRSFRTGADADAPIVQLLNTLVSYSQLKHIFLRVADSTQLRRCHCHPPHRRAKKARTARRRNTQTWPTQTHTHGEIRTTPAQPLLRAHRHVYGIYKTPRHLHPKNSVSGTPTPPFASPPSSGDAPSSSLETRPACRRSLLRCCLLSRMTLRIGATPVPGPTMTRGWSGDCGILNVPGRMHRGTCAPGSRDASQEEHTPVRSRL